MKMQLGWSIKHDKSSVVIWNTVCYLSCYRVEIAETDEMRTWGLDSVRVQPERTNNQ